jgi:hypothetical protein
MILVLAVVMGFTVALVKYRKDAIRRIVALPIRFSWLVLISLILQIPLLRAPGVMSQELRLQQALFVFSYGILLLFIWLNRHFPGILLAGLGILANLVVILANGAAMPITPQILVRINPGSQLQDWQVGLHYPGSKDIIRETEAIRLGWLGDVWVLTKPFPFPTAFSLGDLLIAGGIFWLLADLPYRKENSQKSKNENV